MQSSSRVLVVDDCAEGRRLVSDRLSHAGFAIRCAASGVEALREVERGEPDLVVIDAPISGLAGTGLVRRIRALSDVPVVVMAAAASIPDCEESLRVGVDRYLQLRCDLDRIGDVARALVRKVGPRMASNATGAGRHSAMAGPITAAGARRLAREELRETLERLLLECRGNIAEMARRMGRDRSTIRYHLRRMGMLSAGERTAARRIGAARIVRGSAPDPGGARHAPPR